MTISRLILRIFDREKIALAIANEESRRAYNEKHLSRVRNQSLYEEIKNKYKDITRELKSYLQGKADIQRDEA